MARVATVGVPESGGRSCHEILPRSERGRRRTRIRTAPGWGDCFIIRCTPPLSDQPNDRPPEADARTGLIRLWYVAASALRTRRWEGNVAHCRREGVGARLVVTPGRRRCPVVGEGRHLMGESTPRCVPSSNGAFRRRRHRPQPWDYDFPVGASKSATIRPTSAQIDLAYAPSPSAQEPDVAPRPSTPRFAVHRALRTVMAQTGACTPSATPPSARRPPDRLIDRGLLTKRH